MIKVLVVEDSPVVREFLVYILGADPGIQVIGTANDGEPAPEAAARQRPDVITMDIHMPKLDGLEATRRIMETYPTPIVIVSGSTDPREVATTFRAIEAGARAGLPPPAGARGGAPAAGKSRSRAGRGESKDYRHRRLDRRPAGAANHTCGAAGGFPGAAADRSAHGGGGGPRARA